MKRGHLVDTDDNIEMDLRDARCEDLNWIEMALNPDQLWVFMIIMMNIKVV